MTVGLLPPRPRRPVRIAGLGEAPASRVVSAAALTRPFGKTPEWLLARTGITEVRRLAPSETLTGLASKAGAGALADAQLAEVDLVVVASCSTWPARTGPLSAAIAARLSPRAAAFDLNAACAGFCYALSSAAAFVATGQADSVLVVGAEQMSTICDPADLGTSILFGDGAGAAVVTVAADGREGIAPVAWSSDGGMAGVLEIPAGRATLQMEGQQVFRWAVAEVHAVARAAIAKAGLRHAEIDVFVPHQANLRIVDALVAKLGLQHAATAVDVADTGNTSAASIPMALNRLRRTGAARSGQTALLTGYGAGLSIAAQVVTVP